MGVGSEDHVAVDLAFEGRVLVMSLTHSWFGPRRARFRFDQVRGDVVGLDPLPPRSSSHALQATSAHEELDLAVAHLDPASEGELGLYSATTLVPRESPRIWVMRSLSRA